ncbi:MAG: nicotinate-nucleotide--dimethylbenzimidazole phosphoribosyltransferase [Rhizobacter sp.]|jgi:nicotinate-nucleotide--dimethylbenzimidazole phosphoribosyltransferase
MTDRLPTVEPLAATRLAAALRHRMDRKTKPLGSLGRLEALAVQIGCVLGTEQPALQSPQLVVFAADHGLAARGVSAFPSDVTWQMVENFLAGGAAVSVLARQHGLALTVVDAGVNHDFAPRAGLLDRKVARGTADASVGPAMTAAQCDQALRAGASIVRELPGNVVMFGEMGIGNTSSASLLLSRLTGAPLADCVGRGTGLDDAGLARKLDVLGKALSLHDGVTDPLALMACVGGFEIAMMAGAVLQAAAERRVILVDGFITGAAVLWAARVAPAVLERCIWAHSSAEPGHRVMTKYLGVEPLLDLGMRLGEGSGAALAWPLLVSAVQLLREMASFESAGVSDAGTA